MALRVDKFKTFIVIVMTSLAIVCGGLFKKVNVLNKELDYAKNNIEQYQSLLNKSNSENRVLMMSIDDFKTTNDSLIAEVNKTKDSLKVKDKELRLAMTNTTLIRDTIVNTITRDRDFSVELKPNALTTIKIQRKDTTITCIPEIYNNQDLFVIEKKVWRNKRKNGFQRFIHFDFKKVKINKYIIVNSNPLMKNLETRVIKITK